MTVPLHVSVSQLTSYAMCGEKYRLTKVLGYDEGTAWWFMGGSAVHAATEAYDLVPDLFNPEFAFNRALDAELRRHEFEPGTDADIRSSRGQGEEWWRKNGVEMVRSWVSWREQTGWDLWSDGEDLDHVGVELKLDVLLDPDDEDTRLSGYIDRVFVDGDGQLVVVDLKTGAQPPSSDLQLAMYRLGLQRQFGVTPDLGGYWMARKGELQVVSLEAYDPDHVLRYVRMLRRAQSSGVYMPNVSNFCKSCGVANHCWAVNPSMTESN